MESGSCPITDFPGGLDLHTTLESGQSYVWRRSDELMYQAAPLQEDAWYFTVLPASVTATNEPEVIRVRETDDQLEWEASTPNAYSQLEHLLRLDDDVAAIMETAPTDPLVTKALETYRGLRLVRDPSFACLVSFICSAQMRVARIQGMQTALAHTYGDTVTFDHETYHAFPTPDQLASATEPELRELSLGYRAPYVKQTAEMVVNDEAHPRDAVEKEYEDAREFLTTFVGVGQKVADCVLLFSLGFLEAVPLDTWIRSAIQEHYPECEKGSYPAVSRAIRSRFGGDYAGYIQTYVFHYLRTDGAIVAPQDSTGAA